MTREKMIDILIESRMWDWVYASNYDGLRELLTEGFKGFDHYTVKELKEEIEWFDDETLKQLKSMVKKGI